MKKIIMSKQNEICAKGNRNSGHCKPVVDLTNGTIYSSMLDTSEILNLCYPNLCAQLAGKRKRVGGREFDYLENVKANPIILIKRIQQMAKDIELYKAKADMWDAMIAEQEAARKAEEKRIEDLAKAKAKQQRQLEMLERIKAKTREIAEALAATESEINNLEGKEEEVA